MMEVTPIFSDTWFGSVDSFNHIADSRCEALELFSCLSAYFHSSLIYFLFYAIRIPIFLSFFVPPDFLHFPFLSNHQSHFCFVFSQLYPNTFLSASFPQSLHLQLPLQPRITFRLIFSFNATSTQWNTTSKICFSTLSISPFLHLILCSHFTSTEKSFYLTYISAYPYA